MITDRLFGYKLEVNYEGRDFEEVFGRPVFLASRAGQAFAKAGVNRALRRTSNIKRSLGTYTVTSAG